MSEGQKNKDFIGLTTKECLDTSVRIFENANEMYKEAELLANHGSYGRAVSLLILSTEERMKALILAMDGHKFKFRKKVPGIKILFNKSHQMRHALGTVLSVMYLFTQDLKVAVLKLRDSPKDRTFWNQEKLTPLLLEYFQKVLPKLIQEIKWYSEAEFLRQSGIYVDYMGELKSPSAISKQDFDSVYLRVTNLNDFVSTFTTLLQEDKNNKSENSILYLRDQFEDQNWYEKIGGLIELFRKKGANPLKALAENVQEISESMQNESPDK